MLSISDVDASSIRAECSSSDDVDSPSFLLALSAQSLDMSSVPEDTSGTMSSECHYADDDINMSSWRDYQVLVATSDGWAPTKRKWVAWCQNRYICFPEGQSPRPSVGSDLHNNRISRLTDPEWINRHDFEGTMGGPQSEVLFLALTLLAEMKGGLVWRLWKALRDEPKCDYSWALHSLLILIQDPTDSLEGCATARRTRMFMVSCLDIQEDLSAVMRIALPHFMEMTARIDTLSKSQRISYSPHGSDWPSIHGPSSNIITCLDVAESVAKLVPMFGEVLEGACGIIRKMVQAADNARAALDECKDLAKHTACITLAILSEVGSKSSCTSASTVANVYNLRATIEEVDRRISILSKYGRARYFVSRGRISAEVKELRTRVDNARVVFKLRADISTSALLHDLRVTQTRLSKSVDDINNKLDLILVEVRRESGGGAYVEETA